MKTTSPQFNGKRLEWSLKPAGMSSQSQVWYISKGDYWPMWAKRVIMFVWNKIHGL